MTEPRSSHASSQTSSRRAVYLDHAATTPVRPEVVEAMAAVMGEIGNASSLHAAGRRARRHVEEAREQVAAGLGADPIEVVFTAGGTEADNLAVKGLHWARRQSDPSLRTVATSPAEHHAVLDSVRWLAKDDGAQIAWVEPTDTARVEPGAVRAVLAAAPVSMLSLMWVNNEVGVVNPIAQIAAVAAEYHVPMHTDAVQAVGILPIDFGRAGVDALTISAHKFGGPQGVGALVVRRTSTIAPLLHGGGQERGLRSGSANVAGVVGCGLALSLATQELAQESERLTGLRDHLVGSLRHRVPDLQVNGHEESDPQLTRPGLLSVAVPGCDGDAMLMLLDQRGIYVSTGSACTSGVPEPSHVILAAGGGPDRARSTLRISMGRTTTRADLDALATEIGGVVELARAASGRWPLPADR